MYNALDVPASDKLLEETNRALESFLGIRHDPLTETYTENDILKINRELQLQAIQEFFLRARKNIYGVFSLLALTMGGMLLATNSDNSDTVKAGSIGAMFVGGLNGLMFICDLTVKAVQGTRAQNKLNEIWKTTSIWKESQQSLQDYADSVRPRNRSLFRCII